MFVRGSRQCTSSCASLPAFSEDRREAEGSWSRNPPRDCFRDDEAEAKRSRELGRDRDLDRERDLEREVFTGVPGRQGVPLPDPLREVSSSFLSPPAKPVFPPRSSSSPTSSCGRAAFHGGLQEGERTHLEERSQLEERPHLERQGVCGREETSREREVHARYSNSFRGEERAPAFAGRLADGEMEAGCVRDRRFLPERNPRGVYCGGGEPPERLFASECGDRRAEAVDASGEQKERRELLAFAPFSHPYPAQFMREGEGRAGVYVHSEGEFKGEDTMESRKGREHLHAFHAPREAFPETEGGRRDSGEFAPFLGAKGFEDEADRNRPFKRGFFVGGPERGDAPFPGHPYPPRHFEPQRETRGDARASPPSSPFLPPFRRAEEPPPLGAPVFPLRQGEERKPHSVDVWRSEGAGDTGDTAPPGRPDPRAGSDPRGLPLPSSYFFSHGNLVHAEGDGKLCEDWREAEVRGAASHAEGRPEQRFPFPSEAGAAFSGDGHAPHLSPPPQRGGARVCESSFYPPPGPLPFFDGPYPPRAAYQGMDVGVYRQREGSEGEAPRDYRMQVPFHRSGAEEPEGDRQFFLSPGFSAWSGEGDKREDGREGPEREREETGFPHQQPVPESERFVARFSSHTLEGTGPVSFLVDTAPASPTLPPAFGCASRDPRFQASPLLQPPLRGPDLGAAPELEKPASREALQPNFFHERDGKGAFLERGPQGLSYTPGGAQCELEENKGSAPRESLDCGPKGASFQGEGPAPESPVGFNGPFQPLHMKAQTMPARPCLGHPTACSSPGTRQGESCTSVEDSAFFSTASTYPKTEAEGEGAARAASTGSAVSLGDSCGSPETCAADRDAVVTLPGATSGYPSPGLHVAGAERGGLREPDGPGKNEERHLESEREREYRLQREREERDLMLRQCFFSEPSSPLDRQRNACSSSAFPPSFPAHPSAFPASFVGLNCAAPSVKGDGRGPLCHRPAGGPGSLLSREPEPGERDRFREQGSTTGLLPLPYASPARQTSPGGGAHATRGCLGPGGFPGAPFLGRLGLESGRDEERGKGEGRRSPSSLLGSRPDQAAPFLRLFEESDRGRPEEEGLKGEEWRRRAVGSLDRGDAAPEAPPGDTQRPEKREPVREGDDGQKGDRDGREEEARGPGPWQTTPRPLEASLQWEGASPTAEGDRAGLVGPHKETVRTPSPSGPVSPFAGVSADAGAKQTSERRQGRPTVEDLRLHSRIADPETARTEEGGASWRSSERGSGRRQQSLHGPEEKAEKLAETGLGQTLNARGSSQVPGKDRGDSSMSLSGVGEPEERQSSSGEHRSAEKRCQKEAREEEGTLLKASSAVVQSSEEPLIAGKPSLPVAFSFSSRQREPFSIITSIAAMASPLPPPPGATSTFVNNARAWGMLSGVSPGPDAGVSGRGPSSGTPRFVASSSPAGGGKREAVGRSFVAAPASETTDMGESGASQRSGKTPNRSVSSSREASGGRNRGRSATATSAPASSSSSSPSCSSSSSAAFSLPSSSPSTSTTSSSSPTTSASSSSPSSSSCSSPSSSSSSSSSPSPSSSSTSSSSTSSFSVPGGETAATTLGSFFASPAPKKPAVRESRGAALRSALGGTGPSASGGTGPTGASGPAGPSAGAEGEGEETPVSSSAERWRVFSYAEVCSRGSSGGARGAGGRGAAHAGSGFSRSSPGPDIGRPRREDEAAGRGGTAGPGAQEKPGTESGVSRASSLLGASGARQGREPDKSRDKALETRDKTVGSSRPGGAAAGEEEVSEKTRESHAEAGEKEKAGGTLRGSRPPFTSTSSGARLPAISSNSASLIMDFPASNSSGNSLFSRISQASAAPGAGREVAPGTGGAGKSSKEDEKGAKAGAGASAASVANGEAPNASSSDCSDEEEEAITLLPKELVSPKKEPDVLWEGDGLTVIDKPPGWHCSDVRYDPQTESRQLCCIVSSSRPEPLGLYCSLRFNYPTGKLKECNFGLGHRLDVDTSGPIIIAQTLEAWQWIRDQMHKRNISKEYICLCHGTLAEGFHVIDSPIITSTDGRRLQSYIHHAGQPSLTVVKPLAHLEHRELRYPGSTTPLQFTLNWVKIHTGRTHQIRVHLQSLLDSRGRPHCLVSDDKYGNGQQVEDFQWCRRLFLHQHRLSFRDLNDTPQCFVSPLRADLLSALRHLRVVRSMHDAWHPLRDHLLLGPGQAPGSSCRTSSRTGDNAANREGPRQTAGRDAGNKDVRNKDSGPGASGTGAPGGGDGSGAGASGTGVSGEGKSGEKLEIHVVLTDAEQRAYDAACRAMQQHNQEYRRNAASRCCFSSGSGALGAPYGASLVGGALPVSPLAGGPGGLLLGSNKAVAASALCGPPLIKVGAGLKNVGNSAPLVPLLPPISTAMLGAAGAAYHAHHPLMLNHKGVLGTPGGPQAVALRQQTRGGPGLAALNVPLASSGSSAGLMTSGAAGEEGRDAAGIYSRSNSGTLALSGALGSGSPGGAGSHTSTRGFGDPSGGDCTPASGRESAAAAGARTERDGATPDGSGLDWKGKASQGALSTSSSSGVASSGEATPGARSASSQSSLSSCSSAQNTSRSLLGTGGASRFFGSAANTPPSARSLAFAGRVLPGAGPGLGSTTAVGTNRALPAALDAMVLGGPRSMASAQAGASSAGNPKSSAGSKDGFFRSLRGDSSREGEAGHRLSSAGAGMNRSGPSPSDHQLFSSLGRTSSSGARGDKGTSGETPEKGDGAEGRGDDQGPTVGDTSPPGTDKAGARPAATGPRRQLYKEVLVRSNKGDESGAPTS
ncbi:RNA pseudouridine synthase superfamily protein [Toxoplasma gondii p89]|uniref:RNA pseudouridine synthase superfamily protein n=1 Tax=Toxoplasma gondii p89 TaxID=943119 RepID=A0A086KXV2_TOXGO|nr:RNA pseudouridine synthase superfamily protein [Toxoplasma gondii p89]